MSTAPAERERMRQAADWMAPSDDRILELIREYGNLTPKAIDHFGGPSRQYASERCAELAKYGLLTRVYRGLYGITDEGCAYLDEELDASTLKPTED
jgi:predicted transcriptional regulator